MYKNAKGHWGTGQRSIPNQADVTISELKRRIGRELKEEARERIKQKFPKQRVPSAKSVAIKKAKQRSEKAGRS
jgi:hypothetical protein